MKQDSMKILFFIRKWKSQTNLTPLAKKNLPTLFIIRLPL